MTEAEKYKLSTYQTETVIRQTETATVELVRCSLDDKLYIQKTYPVDKRLVFEKLKTVQNPHLPRIYEAFFDTDTVVIEEYIEGETLQDYLNKKDVSTAFAQKLTDDLLSALSALHYNNIVHRDIKPANILIRPGGQAVLIDFSIARSFTPAQNADTELYGTVGYAAPEQFGFAQTDFRTDIYALGMTLKQLPHLSPRLKKAVARCTAFDPDKRFQTIEETQVFLHRRSCWVLPTLLALMVCIGSLIWWLQTPKTLEASSAVTSSEQTFAQDTPTSDIPRLETIPLREEYRYVGVRNIEQDIPCLQMIENTTYSTIASLSDQMPPVNVTAHKTDTDLTLDVNGKIFIFSDYDTRPSLSYPDGSLYAELLVCDLDGDGTEELITVLFHARLFEAGEGAYEEAYMLSNYAQAWVIDYSREDGFYQADGKIECGYMGLSMVKGDPSYLFDNDNLTVYTYREGKITTKSR